MSLVEHAAKRKDDPIAVVERIASGYNWPFERSAADEIALVVSGSGSTYQLSFSWMNDIEVMHLACAFETIVPERRLPEVQQLVGSINEQLWIGHFEVWNRNGMVMFRHAILLPGGLSFSDRQCEATLGSALDACERYYPAFQYVIWAGKCAREAMDAVMFETSGKA